MGCKIINLEQGLPFVSEALDRLDIQLQLGKGSLEVMLLIHGYGKRSHGGGKIRSAVRDYLHDLKRDGRISNFIIGEEFSMFSRAGQMYVPKFPELRQYATGRNLGVTLVVL